MKLGIIVALVVYVIAGCGSNTPSAKVINCGELYQTCVTSSVDLDAYKACRARVDGFCLGTDAGAE